MAPVPVARLHVIMYLVTAYLAEPRKQRGLRAIEMELAHRPAEGALGHLIRRIRVAVEPGEGKAVQARVVLAKDARKFLFVACQQSLNKLEILGILSHGRVSNKSSRRFFPMDSGYSGACYRC